MGGVKWKQRFGTVAFEEVPGTLFSFKFPLVTGAQKPADGAHYITKLYEKRDAIPSRVEATVKIEATPDTIFGATLALHQAEMRFYLESGDRWWSQPKALKLADTGGEIVFSVPVAPRQWQNVFGKPATELKEFFFASWKIAGEIGVTFGSDDGGFGHGALITRGAARFTLIKFSVK
jgi:hypothetical protein